MKRANAAIKNRQSDIRLTKSNYEFDVYQDVWRLNSDLQINFKLLTPLKLNSSFINNFRIALANYVSELSAGYVQSIYVNIRHLFAISGVSDVINEEHIINFRATLDKSHEWQLGQIRAFILDWHDRGIPGVDKKAVQLLSSIKLKGAEKGKAVAIGCPYSGAYSFDEQTAFINWYVDAFTSELISLKGYSFLIALQYTGARPVQLRYMYHEDLIEREQDAMSCFDLKIPHAKKHKASFRESFQVKDDINEDLYLVLKAQSESSISFIENHFGIKLSDSRKKTIPIFLNENEIEGLNQFEDFLNVQSKTPDLLCLTKSGAGKLIQNIARLCPLKTSRIKMNGAFGDLHINARRFRYTHATNMAMLGASAHIIAEELGHEDTQHVTVYTEFNEEMADRIDEALEPNLTPLAQAFSGTLIDSEKDAIRANDPRSRVISDEGGTVGNCGKYGFCANGTIHCYTCNKFQPWVNAPHIEVLNNVTMERDRKRKMGASEFVLQGHNRSIDAIKVVIRKCEARKQELEKEGALNV
ncbi:site-specific integrase [Pseudoalteromonas sp. BZP1]|uniref:site-specific integrase n=1 Tax=unclassified Pseudoalteromonas TaxID=194690 RepID=UPI0007B8B47E|nr:site-specific integrase [Pseudoalteromonas sp. Cn5-37]KZY44184.1 hypothetical protein A3733_16200 [Pseudoalteromonas shioyasakiensis]MCF2917534.1 site-specific integrase [Pseudoalteromonas sp. Cn5-37]